MLLVPLSSERRESVQRLKASSESHDSSGFGGARAARLRDVGVASLMVGPEADVGRSAARELESRRPARSRPSAVLEIDLLGLSGGISREAGLSVSVCCNQIGSSLLLMILSEADSEAGSTMCWAAAARRGARAAVKNPAMQTPLLACSLQLFGE